MEELNLGLIGGIVGSVLGLVGGCIGTYFSIKNTNGPQESAFMVKVSVVTWIAIALFLACLLFVPKPYNYLAWLVYGICLPLGIKFSNREQEKIRQMENEQG